jgi:ribosomal protein L24
VPSIKKGDSAEWKWGKGKAAGKVTEVFTKDKTETIKGAKITRHASPETPAVELKTAKGAKVLKSVTEITMT